MELLFIVDPLPTLKAYKDSSIAMMREASSREFQIFAAEQAQIFWREGKTCASVRPLTLATSQTGDWYAAGAPVVRSLASFNAVLMRKDPPFDMEYVYSTYLLEAAEAEGAHIFNKPSAIRDHNEKTAILRHSDFIAPTCITRESAMLKDFLAVHGDIILKPLDGMGGSSVFRVHRDDYNLNVIIETLTEYGSRTIMAQRYLPEITQGDKRVLLIAGDPVPYALARLAPPGETRANLAVGGRGVAQPLSARDQEIARALGPVLWKRGLLLVGLDVIGAYVTEINVTSPTCFVEITEQTGFSVAKMFIDALIKTI